MFRCIRCFCAIKKTCPLLSVSKSCLPKFGSYRCYRPFGDLPDDLDFKKKPLTGIDDERFTYALQKYWLDFGAQKEGISNLLSHFKESGQECVEITRNFGNFRIDDRRGKIDMLYTFEKENDLKGFAVHTDSSFDAGYSSASLKITDRGTALFSGHICARPSKGEPVTAGFANFTGPRRKLFFLRPRYYDWSEYTHLVFKVRGDGRSYLILLHIPAPFDDFKYSAYAHQLYTRGGPYWQIAKIPLQHFFLIRKGRVLSQQSQKVSTHFIVKMGVTTGIIDGPFKLEIDYIGLEKKEFEKECSPYENYRT